MAAAETFETPEGVKLWRRDWDNFPTMALVRYRESVSGILRWDIGYSTRDAETKEDRDKEIIGNWAEGSELLGWYPAPNAKSDAAYGDYPGEGLTG